MSGGFGIRTGCTPKIIVIVLAVVVVTALIAGVLLGSAADISVRSAGRGRQRGHGVSAG